MRPPTETTQDRILTVAATLFRERGYHATTMREIARRLDLREPSLYSHITSKQDLLWLIVHQMALSFLYEAHGVAPTLPAEEQLRQLIYNHLALIALHPAPCTVFFREWTCLDPDQQASIRKMRNAYEVYFSRVIELGIQQNIFHVADARLACLFVLSALNWTHQWFTLAGPLSLTQFSERYSTLLLHALRRGG